ncbi:hypothetical protein FPQ18DRAFT_344307 [Pyronema domesticum]|nr:hypothetical protein FPQ18DRAFT_344307 [Pyronema domesticum]
MTGSEPNADVLEGGASQAVDQSSLNKGEKVLHLDCWSVKPSDLVPDSSTEPKPNNKKYKKHKKTSRPNDDHLWFTRSHVYMSGKRRVSPVDETVGNKRYKNEKITNTNQACDEGHEGEYKEEHNEEHMQAQSSSGNQPLHPESFDASKEHEERGYAADSNSSDSNSNDDSNKSNSNDNNSNENSNDNSDDNSDDSSGSDPDSDDEYESPFEMRRRMMKEYYRQHHPYFRGAYPGFY